MILETRYGDSDTVKIHTGDFQISHSTTSVSFNRNVKDEMYKRRLT